ncbi:uncharacterized protein EV422DRAFT_255958 [Fimicolochytrium jonesii]|uniref:uncharacterized protein n=1 Tax=Fimicolochytrium jonesii TaxID=1396493 RepID=UPI0022FE97B6|nr:uncharacterized protein EV422DRAFT_255958 [Fimicolochytrium jonesii]KAI8817125.1 hypothetical protein EV422DRAFT_255958 [Fimicolochytrium jonesii]
MSAAGGPDPFLVPYLPFFFTRSIGKRKRDADQEDEDDSFAYISSRGKTKTASIRRRMCQRYIKRMLSRDNCVDRTDLENKRFPEHEEFIAAWVPPIRKNTTARVYKRGFSGVVDYVDNSGRYVPEEVELEDSSDRPGMPMASTGYTNKVAGGYTCKRADDQLLDGGDDDEDEVLPPYGQSDKEDYAWSDESEWSDEEREAKPAKQPEQPAPKAAEGDGKENVAAYMPLVNGKKVDVSNGDVDDDLRDYTRTGRQRSTLSAKAKRFWKTREEAPMPAVVGSTKFLSSDDIRTIVAEEFEKMRATWDEVEKPKLELEAHNIYHQYEGMVEALRAEIMDLETRRLEGHLNTYACLRVQTSKEVRTQCAASSETIRTICEKLWIVDLLHGEPPEPPRRPERKKINSARGKKKSGTKAAAEKESWSDFIASEDEFPMEVPARTKWVHRFGSDTDEEAAERPPPWKEVKCEEDDLEMSAARDESDDTVVSPEVPDEISADEGTIPVEDVASSMDANAEESGEEMIIEPSFPAPAPRSESPTSPKTPPPLLKQNGDLEVTGADESMEELNTATVLPPVPRRDSGGPSTAPVPPSKPGRDHGVISLVSDDEPSSPTKPQPPANMPGAKPSGFPTSRLAKYMGKASNPPVSVDGSSSSTDDRAVPNSEKAKKRRIPVGGKIPRDVPRFTKPKSTRSKASQALQAEKALDGYFIKYWSLAGNDSRLLKSVNRARQDAEFGILPDLRTLKQKLHHRLVMEFVHFVQGLHAPPEDEEGVEKVDPGTIRDQWVEAHNREQEKSDFQMFIEFRLAEKTYDDVDDRILDEIASASEADAEEVSVHSQEEEDSDLGARQPATRKRSFKPTVNKGTLRRPTSGNNTIRRAVPRSSSPISVEDIASGESDGPKEQRLPHPKGRREIKAIQPENLATLNIRNKRRQQDAQIASRAKAQQKRFNGPEKKILINLGHDDSEEDIFIPNFLARELFDHQVQGVQFMWKNILMVKQPSADGHGMRHAGCILAHAQGLGKTIQTITLIYTLFREIARNNPAVPEHLKNKQALIVVPPIVLENWAREFNQWVARSQDADSRLVRVLSTALTLGDMQRLEQIRDWHENGGVLLATYDYITGMHKNLVLAEAKLQMDPRKETELASFVALRKTLFEGASLIVCDEGHYIKNSESQRANALGLFQTPSRVLLTGTPLQNHLSEYWVMIDYAVNNYLGDLKEFRNAYENPINNGLHIDSTEMDKKLSRLRLYALTKLIEPIVQRKDTSVLKTELKPKTEYVIDCKVTQLQYELLRAYLTNADLREENAATVLARVPSLKQLCAHPQIFKEELEKKKSGAVAKKARIDKATPATDPGLLALTSEPGQDEIGEDENTAADGLLQTLYPTFDEIFAKYSPGERSRGGSREGSVDGEDDRRLTGSDTVDIVHSNKMKVLVEIVRTTKNMGKKILIFTSSIPTLYFIVETLKKEQINVLSFDGSTSLVKRQRDIDAFNKESKCTAFAISLKAGNLGINLSAASRVILFDLTWNPSDAEQAISRAYRYRQQEEVIVYRIQAHDTFESTLYKKNIQKLALSKHVVDQKQTSRNFTKAEMKQYFRVPDMSDSWQLSPEDEDELFPVENPDPPLEAVLRNLREDLVAVRKHSDMLQEVEDEMNDEEKAASTQFYEDEKARRRMGMARRASSSASMNIPPSPVKPVTPVTPVTPNLGPEMPRTGSMIEQLLGGFGGFGGFPGVNVNPSSWMFKSTFPPPNGE